MVPATFTGPVRIIYDGGCASCVQDFREVFESKACAVPMALGWLRLSILRAEQKSIFPQICTGSSAPVPRYVKAAVETKIV